MNTFGEIIKSYRINLNLKQSSIAKMIGVSQSNYSRIENDKVLPTLPILYKLSIYLKFSIDRVLKLLYDNRGSIIESYNLLKKL